MPNYVANKLTVTTTNEELLNAFLNAVESEESSFDFNKIVPMPEEIKNTEESTKVSDALYYYLWRNGKEQEIYEIYTFPYTNNDYSNKRKSELDVMYALGERYYNIYQKYGAVSWYYWCLNNWGTKWNASYADINTFSNGAIIYFQTAWSGVPELIKKLSEMFPELNIEYKYADEDFTYNCGYGFTNKGGFEFNVIENASEKAFETYCECWREDEDDYVYKNGFWYRAEDCDEFEDEE